MKCFHEIKELNSIKFVMMCHSKVNNIIHSIPHTRRTPHFLYTSLYIFFVPKCSLQYSYISLQGRLHTRMLVGAGESIFTCRTGGKIVVADQIYRGRFLFASKNCESNKNTDFTTLFLVLQQRKSKRKLADVNFNKRQSRPQLLVAIGKLEVKNSSLKHGRK